MRTDFPFFERYSGIYLDSACTSIKPSSVIDAINIYYTDFSSCSGRSSHSLARRLNEELSICRKNIANFVNADNVVFVKNTTEGLNLIINNIPRGKKVLSTIMEHHAVLLPLIHRGVDLHLVPPNELIDTIDDDCYMVITNAVNNTTGAIANMHEISKKCKDLSVKLTVDGAQAVPHIKIDFDYDYLCFSAHKMCGPTGIGAIAFKDLDFDPLIFGGGTVTSVSTDSFDLVEDYRKYEAGIQHYAGIFGFSAACDYLESVGWENIHSHEQALRKKIDKILSSYTVYGSGETATTIFNIPNAKPHEVALMLDQENVAVRSGYFCAEPGVKWLGASEGAVRISAYLYNTLEEISIVGDKLEDIAALF